MVVARHPNQPRRYATVTENNVIALAGREARGVVAAIPGSSGRDGPHPGGAQRPSAGTEDPDRYRPGDGQDP